LTLSRLIAVASSSLALAGAAHAQQRPPSFNPLQILFKDLGAAHAASPTTAVAHAAPAHVAPPRVSRVRATPPHPTPAPVAVAHAATPPTAPPSMAIAHATAPETTPALAVLAHAMAAATQAAADSPTRPEVVRASWYGGGERLSRYTSNGDVFVPMGLTAAHRTLPFGTLLRVSSPLTGLSTIVRINDRGPAASTGRALDLSRGAAMALGIVGKGETKVTIEVMR
jgi:rare lipoprotein A